VWNPNQYNKYFKERHRPALELIERIPQLTYQSIIDLGCGDGTITSMLHEKYSPQNIIGLDSSASMLATASKNNVNITWQQGDIAKFNDSYDLIFSNAALQWVVDHESLFKKLALSTQKVLAVQMPNNFSEPSHVLLRETISENHVFKDKLFSSVRANPVFNKDVYYKLLRAQMSSLDVWETEYLQSLSGENPVLEWVRGTALVPIKEKLSVDEYNQFECIYGSKLKEAYPMTADNMTLFPFKRIFIVATK
jgi:trans-aconitate 2-methyltransferase